MANFAEIGLNNTVISLAVVADAVEDGAAFLREKRGGTWLAYSKSGAFRVNGAIVGGTYNSTLDAFIPPSPYPSWTLNESTCQWEAPVACPGDEIDFVWDETTQNWIAQ